MSGISIDYYIMQTVHIFFWKTRMRSSLPRSVRVSFCYKFVCTQWGEQRRGAAWSSDWSNTAWRRFLCSIMPLFWSKPTCLRFPAGRDVRCSGWALGRAGQVGFICWEVCFFFFFPPLFTLQENITLQLITLVRFFDVSRLFSVSPKALLVGIVWNFVFGVMLWGSLFGVQVKGL